MPTVKAEIERLKPLVSPDVLRLIEHQARVIATAREALAFYSGSFAPHQAIKHLPGFAWKPTEELLDDCGNRAEDALALLSEDAEVRA